MSRQARQRRALHITAALAGTALFITGSFLTHTINGLQALGLAAALYGAIALTQNELPTQEHNQ